MPASLILMRRQAQDRLREAPGDIEEKHVFDLLAGAAEPVAEHGQQGQPDLRALSEKGDELPPFEYQQLAVLHGAGVGGARTPVEQRDLAEDLAGLDDVQRDLFAVRGGNGDFHAAGHHRHEAAAGISLGKDRGAFFRMHDPRITREAIKVLGREAGEKRMSREQLAFGRRARESDRRDRCRSQMPGWIEMVVHAAFLKCPEGPNRTKLRHRRSNRKSLYVR